MKYILLSAIVLMSGCVHDAKETAAGFQQISDQCPKGGTVIIKLSISSFSGQGLNVECRYVKGGV